MEVPITNCTALISETCEAMQDDKHPVSLTFFITAEQEVIVSLRSNNPEYNVKDMAKVYGGGGHAQASGFKIALPELPDLLSGKL